MSDVKTLLQLVFTEELIVKSFYSTVVCSELKEQLMELETFAYESGQGELPQSVLVEKQKAMIDQLRSRLNINLDDFDHLSTEELKKIVDSSLQRYCTITTEIHKLLLLTHIDHQNVFQLHHTTYIIPNNVKHSSFSIHFSKCTQN